jgi:hypothetical protein
VIKGIVFDVYIYDGWLWLVNRETQALFRSKQEDYVWALSFSGDTDIFTNFYGDVRKCDVENGGEYMIDFIHRNPSNALVTDITLETAQYDFYQNDKPRTFAAVKDGDNPQRSSSFHRTTKNSLVKFYKLGRGVNSRFEIYASGYLRGVSITDTEMGQKRA